MTQDLQLVHRINMIEDDAKAFIEFLKSSDLYDRLLQETDRGTGLYYIHNILTACDLDDVASLDWKLYKSKQSNMEKLNQIIESMAKAKYKSEIDGITKRNEFILKHATIGEFIKFFTTKKTAHGGVWSEKYGSTTLGGMSGLADTFCFEVLWPKLRDKYIEDAVKSLDDKVEQSFRVTIESIK